MKKMNKLFLFFLLAMYSTIASSNDLEGVVSNLMGKASDVIKSSRTIVECSQKIERLKKSDREIDQKLLNLSQGSTYHGNGHEIMHVFAEYGEESIEEEEFANFVYSNRYNRSNGEDRLASPDKILSLCKQYDRDRAYRDLASHNENINNRFNEDDSLTKSGTKKSTAPKVSKSIYSSMIAEAINLASSKTKTKIVCEKLATNDSVSSKEVCNQLAGEVVSNPSENGMMSLASVVLNNTDAMFELKRDRKTCKDCFKSGIKPKKFQREQRKAAKNIIEKLNEEKLEKELYKLSGAMEMMLKLQSIRGRAILAGAREEGEADTINSLNCRSAQDLEKLIEAKCPGKSKDVQKVLAKVSPVKLDSEDPINSLFKNLYKKTKYIDDAKCESGVRSMAMNQKMEFMHSFSSSTSMKAVSRKTLNGLVSVLSKDEKVKKSICDNSQPKFARILGGEVLKSMNSSESNEVKKIMNLYMNRYKKNYERRNNVTISNSKDFGFQREALIAMFEKTIKADPSYNVLLHDKEVFCDFAARGSDNGDLDSYLNYKKDLETEDEFNKRQFEIAKKYSKNTCAPILENISSLVCGENLPDLKNENSYKDYMRENFSPDDIKEKAKEYLAQNNEIGILYNKENTRVPAVGSLHCELSDNSNVSFIEPANFYKALANGSFEADSVSSYLIRASKDSDEHKEKLKAGKHNSILDDLSEKRGTGRCENQDAEQFYNLSITQNVFGEEPPNAEAVIAKEIAQNDGYNGHVPENLSDLFDKKITNKNVSNNSKSNDSIIRGTANASSDSSSFEGEASNLLSESVMSQINSSPDYIYDAVEESNSFSSSDIINSIADDVEDEEDIKEITSSPKEMANYSSWKEEKEKSERLLQERIKSLTKEIDTLKKGDVASNNLDEISTKESEIKALEKSLDKIKNEKYAVNKAEPKKKINAVAAKSNTVVRDNPVTNNNAEESTINSISSPVETTSNNNSNIGARSVVDNSFKSGQSNYLVLQDASGGVASQFVDMIESDRVDEIEVKYGANGIPMYVKIPGQTLFVAVSELDEDSKKLILESLSRKDKEKIVAEISQKNLGRKIASVVDEEKAQLINLKVTTYFNMYEVASSSGDEVLQKFYLKKIKPLDPTLYKILSDKK